MQGEYPVGRPKIATAQLRRIAVEAECDPRTVLAALQGKPGRGPARERAIKALAANGYSVEANK